MIDTAAVKGVALKSNYRKTVSATVYEVRSNGIAWLQGSMPVGGLLPP
jgi:hypothetical protein